TNSFNAGGAFPQASTLYSNPAKLAGYDIVMLSCEGSQYPDTKMPYVNNMLGYMNAGGRLFLSHLHFYWLRTGPARLPPTATYIGVAPKLYAPAPGTVNTTFPKGNALADWLVTVGASTTRGQLDIYAGQHSVAAVTAPTQSWITVPANTAATGPQPSVQ